MKKALILPVLLALAACADSPEQSFAKAQSEFAAHNYAAARIHLTGALQAKPGNRAMQLLLAKTLLALGDGDGAGAALAQLTGTGAPNGELAELAAEAALLRKAPDVALGLLGAATSVEAERLRALALIQQQDMAGAQKHFETGLAAGGSARLFSDYARYRLLSGDIAGADELAAKAAKADPDGIDTLLVTGLIAVRHGNLQQALERYQRATKLYPASVAALTGSAAVLGDLGRGDEMQKVLDRAAVVAPTDPTVVFLRARNAALKSGPYFRSCFSMSSAGQRCVSRTFSSHSRMIGAGGAYWTGVRNRARCSWRRLVSGACTEPISKSCPRRSISSISISQKVCERTG